jgi:hypothetical protein
MASAQQLADAAFRAGWRGQDLIVAVAVGLAESGGNPAARNTSGGADSRGVWQINVAAGAHPEYADRNLYDLDTNAAAAFEIWKAHGWGPWQAHNNGAYLLRMPAALAAVEARGLNKIGAAASDAASAAAAGAFGGVGIGALSDAAHNIPGADALSAARSGLAIVWKAGAWMADPHNWLRVVQVAVGGGLIIGGIVIVARPVLEPIGKKAAKGAKVAALL